MKKIFIFLVLLSLCFYPFPTSGEESQSSVQPRNYFVQFSSLEKSVSFPQNLKKGDPLTLNCRLFGQDNGVDSPFSPNQGLSLFGSPSEWKVEGVRFLPYPDYLYSLESSEEKYFPKGETGGISFPKKDYGGLLEIKLIAQRDNPKGLRLSLEGNPELQINDPLTKGTPLAQGGNIEIGKFSEEESSPLPLQGIITPPPRVGTWKPVVVLVEFPDNRADPSSTRSFFQNLLFSATGTSMTTYFRENSWNQLNLVGTVYWNQADNGWVMAPQTYSFYSEFCGGMSGYPRNTQKLAEDLLDLIDPYANFSQHDGNGDGVLDGFLIVYSGNAEGSNKIWPHTWSITPQVRDGIIISDYCVVPEFEQRPLDTDISVYCHEYAHILGAYDLYDYDNGSAGLGLWSLMAFDNKQHFDPWHKVLFGWVTPTVINSSQSSYPIPPVETTRKILRVNLGDPTEYYLIENRENIGFDCNLPGFGLLIWHIDEDATFNYRINNFEWFPPDCIDYGHFTVALEQADGLYELEKYSNTGDRGDPFSPGKSFTPISNPSSCDYEGRNWNVQITNIKSSGNSIYVDFDFSLNYPLITWFSKDTGPISKLLQGSTNNNGNELEVWFEWGTSTSYGNTTSSIIVGASGTPTTFFYHLKTGLVPDTIYHFRVVCKNSQGLFYGEDRTFQTYSRYQWKDLGSKNPPPSRYGHAMAYDSIHKKVIMFGGWDLKGNLLNDTWAYDYETNTWTNLNPSNPPPKRAWFSMVFDSTNEKMVLFGGYTPGSGALNDTWAYDYETNTWTNLNPSNPPPERIYHSLVFDTFNKKVILFGGIGRSAFHLNDTWAYDYETNTWTNLNPSNPPPSRYGHAMAYDSIHKKVIMFGGWDSKFNLLNDTWAYDYETNTWTNLNPSNPPPGLAEHAMVFHYSQNKVIMFGKHGSGETWAYFYPQNIWQKLKICSNPPGSRSPAMTYIQESGEIVLFGGYAIENPSDNGKVWKLIFEQEAPYWQNQVPGITPPPRESHAMVYDTFFQKVILFGGVDPNGFDLNDTWAYDFKTNTWTNLNPSDPPLARSQHSLVFDSFNKRVILFGGHLNDTWAYDYETNTWTNLNPSNPPPSRYGHAMAYDSIHKKVIMFGGWDLKGNLLNDTWAYDYETNTWTNLNPSNPPPKRAWFSMVFDSANEKIVLFGGYSRDDPAPGFLNDTWAYDYETNTWTNLNPSNPPPGLVQLGMAFDSFQKKLIMYGGVDVCSNFPQNTWAFDFFRNTWEDFEPLTIPYKRKSHAMVYDVAHKVLIIFGGYNPQKGNLNDTWALVFPETQPPSLSFSPTSFTFTATQGGSTPPPQVLEVWNSGGGSMNWNAWDNSGWLSLSPTSGTSSGEHDLISVSVDISGLTQGTYTGTITLSGEGASNSPAYIPVSLQVNQPKTLASLSLSPSSWTFTSSSPKQFQAIAYFSDGSSQDVTSSSNWSSDDPSIAQVNASGLVTPLSNGSTIIRASYTYSGVTRSSQAQILIDFSGKNVNYTLHLNQGWNLISLPISTNPDPKVVFSGLPTWRMFSWNAITGSYLDKNHTTLSLGKGYWLWVPNAVDYEVSGEPNTSSSFEIPLYSGWNLIGTPYDGSIPWDHVLVRRGNQTVSLNQAVENGWVRGTAYFWESNSYKLLKSGGSFLPLYGYWFYAKVEGCSLIFGRP